MNTIRVRYAFSLRGGRLARPGDVLVVGLDLDHASAHQAVYLGWAAPITVAPGPTEAAVKPVQEAEVRDPEVGHRDPVLGGDSISTQSIPAHGRKKGPRR